MKEKKLIFRHINRSLAMLKILFFTIFNKSEKVENMKKTGKYALIFSQTNNLVLMVKSSIRKKLKKIGV